MQSTRRIRDGGSLLDWSTTTRLIVTSAYAVGSAAVLSLLAGLPTAVRLPLGLPLLLFAPGYAILYALFPDDGRSESDPLTDSARDWGPLRLAAGERLVLAVVSSVAVVPMVAVAVNAVVGVRLAPILAGVAGVTILGAAIGIVRAPSEAVTYADGTEAGGGRTGWQRALSDPLTLVAVALTALLLASSAGLVVVDGGAPDAPNTEFYVLDERTGDDAVATFELRIAQDALAEQSYTVVAVRGANASDWTEIDRVSVTVPADDPATGTFRVSRHESNTTVRFLLYEGEAPASPDPASAHRTLRQSVTGTG